MENKAVMVFFAIEPKHHAAILSLVAPATPAHKLLDPFAGEGEFLEVAAQAWNIALWRHNQPTPEGYEPHQRLVKKRVPKCPHCGQTIMQESKGAETPATERWLMSGKRACSVCLSPLWQEARDKGSQPKAGEAA